MLLADRRVALRWERKPVIGSHLVKARPGEEAAACAGAAGRDSTACFAHLQRHARPVSAVATRLGLSCRPT